MNPVLQVKVITNLKMIKFLHPLLNQTLFKIHKFKENKNNF